MRYSRVFGVLLSALGFFFAPAAAAFRDGHPAASNLDTTAAIPENATDRGSAEKTATPPAQPELGEEALPDDESEEDEEGADCDGCFLSQSTQPPVEQALANAAWFSAATPRSPRQTSANGPTGHPTSPLKRDNAAGKSPPSLAITLWGLLLILRRGPNARKPLAAE